MISCSDYHRFLPRLYAYCPTVVPAVSTNSYRRTSHYLSRSNSILCHPPADTPQLLRSLGNCQLHKAIQPRLQDHSKQDRLHRLHDRNRHTYSSCVRQHKNSVRKSTRNQKLLFGLFFSAFSTDARSAFPKPLP